MNQPHSGAGGATAPKVKLSATVITFNEEEKIADCLDSLSFADEMVVVDSGSTDRTVEIARAKGARVVLNKWGGHIQQRNFAIGQAAGEWVLNLDADERISDRLKGEILSAIGNSSADGFVIPRMVFYINRWIRYCGWYPAPKIRLFRKGKGRATGENPHDRIELDGRLGKMKGDIYHFSFDNISDHLATINNFTEIAARERMAKGKRAGISSIILRPPAMFIKMYFFKGGFMDGIPGFIVCALSAYHVFCKYTKLREMGGR